MYSYGCFSGSLPCFNSHTPPCPTMSDCLAMVYPKLSTTESPFSLPFLVQKFEPAIENNLFPFLFLYPDGNLFIFANNRAILFDYSKNMVLKTYPIMPSDQPRNYPSTGSAMLLPLQIKGETVNEVEVLVCGGAPKGAYFNAYKRGIFDRALDRCGRIKICDPNPQWVMETMPLAQVMGDMLLLPNGHVLIINGASSGVAGRELGCIIKVTLLGKQSIH